jgi:hypothetical protein
MEKLYAIHAYEGFFQGLHGVENRDVIECECDEEACEIAAEMSREVIDDYCDSIPDIHDLIGEGDDELEEAIEDDIDYTVYKLTVPTNASLDELYNHFNNDPEDFLKQYGAEAI